MLKTFYYYVKIVIMNSVKNKNLIVPVIPLPGECVVSDGRAGEETVYTRQDGIPSEGYMLICDDKGINVLYSDDKGRFYANKTLDMLKSYYKEGLPHLRISDCPRLKYRGFMLDVARYFFKTEDLKKLADALALMKINVLHLHLTDDQGWRMEIEKYPLLTEIGSKRSSTNGNFKKHEGFYTRAEMKDFVEFAKERHITVIPEIDCPGHMRAALAAYPELGCFGRKLKVADHWGVKHDIMCAGKESSYAFLFDVFDEVLEIFTGGYLHLGADEAVKTRWKICPHCRRAIQKGGLKDENALQVAFLNRINREYLRPKGVKGIIWVYDEVPDGLDEDIIVQVYGENAFGKGIDLKGHTAIDSDSAAYYADFPYGITPLEKTFGHEPDGTKVAGAEICLWTEYVKDFAKVGKMSFPRSCAAAERMWNNNTGYDDFVLRLEASNIIKEYGGTPVKAANPSAQRAILQKIWWGRRPLHWEGLKNLIENIAVKIRYTRGKHD